jgi:hypothetical protein
MTMLVPFVIDADSLKPDQSLTPPQQRSYYLGLLDLWQRAGLLGYDGQFLSGSKLHRAVQSLPQSVRPRWLELLERSPTIPIPAWDCKVSRASIGNFSSIAQLAFVDDTIAEVEFGFDQNCDEALESVSGKDVSICRITAVGQANVFQAVNALAGAHIQVGDPYQEIWDTRFATLAKASIKRISIVDRYAIGQLMTRDQTVLSGLERFLRLLDKDATGDRHVTIYSAWTHELSGKTIDNVESDLRDVFSKLQKKNIKRIKIVMAPNKVFREDSHDRFIRFGNYVWDIGGGVKVFEGPSCRSRSSATFKSGTTSFGYEKVEQELASDSETKTKQIP